MFNTSATHAYLAPCPSGCHILRERSCYSIRQSHCNTIYEATAHRNEVCVPEITSQARSLFVMASLRHIRTNTVPSAFARRVTCPRLLPCPCSNITHGARRSRTCHSTLRQQLVASTGPILSRTSHVCGSLKQTARDALDALDGQKRRRCVMPPCLTRSRQLSPQHVNRNKSSI